MYHDDLGYFTNWSITEHSIKMPKTNLKAIVIENHYANSPSVK